jgi:hypothetical protein
MGCSWKSSGPWAWLVGNLKISKLLVLVLVRDVHVYT